MANTGGKRSTLMDKMTERIKSGNSFCSFEILPPRNLSEIHSVLKSVDMVKQECDPLFCSLTWHLRDLPTSGMNMIPHVFDLVSSMSKHELLLHIAAKNLSKEIMLDISTTALTLGINNFFALRGDKVKNSEINDFPHAVNLVQFLRKHFGRSIVICVAGYPGGHPESHSYEDDLKYLKEKVDAGADFIITQIIFDAEIFEHFVNKCRNIGITVPIIPGIMPIKDYASLQSISKLCHLKVPKQILDILEPIRDNDDSVQSFGIFHATEMAKKILLSKQTFGIHFFTMNRVRTTVMICEILGFGTISITKSLHLTVESEGKSLEKST